MRVPAEDAEGRKKLAGYRLRAPMFLEQMTYEVATGTVIYRSKRPLGSKRNFQVMPGAEWLALLCKQTPDRDGRTEHRSGITAALHWHRTPV